MVPYLRVANVLDGYIDYSDVYQMHFSASEQEKYTVRCGDILLNEGQSTELVGRSAVYEGPEDTYCFQNSLVNFRCGPLVTSHFARAVFKRWLEIGHFMTIVKQTTSMAHLGGERFANLDFPVPPLLEQHQIAAVLGTVDDAIRKTEQIIAKLKQVKQGLLHDLLTRGIDDNGELRDPERHPQQFKDSPLGRIPRDWEVVRLLDLVSLPSGQVDPRVQPFSDWILVAPDHIESASGRLIQKVSAHEQGAISGKYAFRPGEVVYSKIRPYLRKALLADFEGLCSADMYPLRPGDALEPRFLLAIILSEHFSRFAETVSMRSGFPKINREELREYVFPCPPRVEQGSIGMLLTGHEHRLRLEEVQAEKLRLFKQGLMEDLLTGRVRVTKLLENAAK